MRIAQIVAVCHEGRRTLERCSRGRTTPILLGFLVGIVRWDRRELPAGNETVCKMHSCYRKPGQDRDVRPCGGDLSTSSAALTSGISR